MFIMLTNDMQTNSPLNGLLDNRSIGDYKF